MLISQGESAVRRAPPEMAQTQDLRLFNSASGYAGGVLGSVGDPWAQMQRQLLVAGGAHDGEVLARYGNVASGGANTTYGWINEHYVDAPLLQSGGQGTASEVSPSSANTVPGLSGAGASGSRLFTVMQGQRLQDIARATLGDERLWYRIAQANALASDADLKPGMVIRIPGSAAAGASSNTSNTFRPYDPTRATGDLSPVLPMPGVDEGCGEVGQVIALVVAIVVTYYTNQALGEGVWAAMTAAAAGNLAGQVTGNVLEVQDGIDWKSVAVSAISAGATQGVSSAMGGVPPPNTASAMARAAIANVLTQGDAVALGLQDHFDWRGVVASAVGAGASEAMGPSLQASGLSQPVQAGVRAFTAGLATAVARGGRVEIQQIAVNAFGQALGTSVAGSGISTSGTENYSAEEMAGDYAREANRFASAAALNREEALAMAGQGLRSNAGGMGLAWTQPQVNRWSADIDAGISRTASVLRAFSAPSGDTTMGSGVTTGTLYAQAATLPGQSVVVSDAGGGGTGFDAPENLQNAFRASERSYRQAKEEVTQMTPQDSERKYKREHVSPAIPKFAAGIDPYSLSDHTLVVLNALALEAKLDIGQLLVTSTIRTPADQARIMFGHLENGGLSTYGPAGRQLVEIYKEGVKSGDEAAAIREKMAARAQSLLDQGVRVSNHLGDPTQLNVFDVDPASIPANRRQMFQEALSRAKSVGTVEQFFSPYTVTFDKAFHIEVRQPSKQELFRKFELRNGYAN